MKRNLKKAIVSVLAGTTLLAVSVPAYAATDESKISEVEFRVTWTNGKPEVGDSRDFPDIELAKGGNKCTIDESSIEWSDGDDDDWTRGEKPTIYLTVDANEGYYFSSTDVSMTKSSYKVARRSGSDRDELKVKITLDAVEGDLDSIEDCWWDGRTAHWEEVDDADKYEVKLYRNGSTVTTVTTSGSSYNLYPYMTKSGDYTFKVRGISNSDGETSDWSDESDEYYMNASDVYTGAPPTSGSSSGNGGWLQDAYGWTYWQNGTMVTNSWIYVDNEWYYMAANGYMMTGWIFVDNNWFYLNPISDGTRGAMKTGWQAIDGYWYYLNPVSDGTRGARKTSYQLIDGKWYFLDVTSGALWVNRAAPNGMVADSNGVLH